MISGLRDLLHDAALQVLADLFLNDYHPVHRVLIHCPQISSKASQTRGVASHNDSLIHFFLGTQTTLSNSDRPSPNLPNPREHRNYIFVDSTLGGTMRRWDFFAELT